jgi:CRP-like cAMP-binding protein
VVADLISHHMDVRYAKGSTIFLQGSPADMLMVVLTGIVKVYCPRPDRSVLVGLAGSGDVLGFTDYLDAKGRHAQAMEAKALTNCVIALFTRDQILKLLESLPAGQLLRIFEQVNTLWSAVAYRYAGLLSLSYRERLEWILADVGARFGIREARGIFLSIELGHEDWARMIGSSRPMVSRLMADLTRAGMIAREGKRYILLNGGGLENRKPSLVPGFPHTAATEYKGVSGTAATSKVPSKRVSESGPVPTAPRKR